MYPCASEQLFPSRQLLAQNSAQRRLGTEAGQGEPRNSYSYRESFSRVAIRAMRVPSGPGP